MKISVYENGVAFDGHFIQGLRVTGASTTRWDRTLDMELRVDDLTYVIEHAGTNYSLPKPQPQEDVIW